MTESRACSQVSYRYREPSSTWAEGEPSPSHGNAAAHNLLATAGAQPPGSLANTHLLLFLFAVPRWELGSFNICGKVSPRIGAAGAGSGAGSGLFVPGPLTHTQALASLLPCPGLGPRSREGCHSPPLSPSASQPASSGFSPGPPLSAGRQPHAL